MVRLSLLLDVFELLTTPQLVPVSSQHPHNAAPLGQRGVEWKREGTFSYQKKFPSEIICTKSPLAPCASLGQGLQHLTSRVLF